MGCTRKSSNFLNGLVLHLISESHHQSQMHLLRILLSAISHKHMGTDKILTKAKITVHSGG